MQKGKKAGSYKDVLAGASDSAKPSKKAMVREISIRKGAKGGYIAKHRMEDEHGNHHPQQPEYPLADKKALYAHMDEHMCADEEE